MGPVEVFPDTLQAMAKPMIIHRGKDYQQVQKAVVEKLHKVLDTDMEIYLSPASATGFLESCVRCGVSKKMLGITNGSFGDRWQQIGTLNGKLVDKIEVQWGKAVRKEHIQGKIGKDIEAVTFVSNESSTGVLNPVLEVAEAVKAEGDPLLFVDGVTSVGAVDLHIRKMNPDALVFGSQKALALPPGLAIICVSPPPAQEGGDSGEPRLLLRPAGDQEVRRQGPPAHHAGRVPSCSAWTTSWTRY